MTIAATKSKRARVGNNRTGLQVKRKYPSIEKTPTGIEGFDEITFGGLPTGRPTLIAGYAGCGKTLFGMEFLARGAAQFNEPGVMVSFEENTDELVKNFSSLGFDLAALIKNNKLLFEYIAVERNEIEETGEYNLDGLFVRLEYAVNSIGAKRIVLDTIESLFAALPNEFILRAELRRLFKWLKAKGLTAIITGERGVATFTRQGLEEYVADCVILVEHKVTNMVATRRMRVVKYRGSAHGSDEFPFLINQDGISVLPITSINLDHRVSRERVSTGIPRLDDMLEGKGFFRGSSILISGSAGTGKTTLAAHFAEAAARRGEKVLYFAFEESPDQIIRNMESIGVKLESYIKSGMLKILASRPSAYGLEMHLATMHQAIVSFEPKIIIMDPISNMISVGAMNEVKSMLVRLIDFLKQKQITAVCTDLTTMKFNENTEVGISSLMDAWILMRTFEVNGERNRGIYVLKARGMKNSNQVREFMMTPNGIDLIDVYTGPEGIFTGSARVAQEASNKAAAAMRRLDMKRKQREVDRKRQMLDAEMALLKSRYEAEEDELQRAIQEHVILENAIVKDRAALETARMGVKRNVDRNNGRKRK